jgi:rhamnosyl/mannosyltransferase
MLKVLHVYRTYYPDTQGGLEEVIKQICQNVDAGTIKSRIFTLSHTPKPNVTTYNGVEIYRYPNHMEIASCGISLTALPGFKNLVDWADIVHYHFPWPFADMLHFLAKVNKPTLVTYHSDIVRQKGLLRLYSPLMHAYLKNVDTIVATSPGYAQSSDILQRYTDKVTVIPLGLQAGGYPVLDNVICNNLYDKFGPDFFLFIGNLRYYKGLHILLDAIKGQNINVIIAGSGPEEQRLKLQARQHRLENVHFLGHVSDNEKVALINLCRAIVFPSHLRSEAFGVTLLEGAMYGKPLISTEIGTGTSYVNQDQVTGIVVPASDPLALREAMLKLKNNDHLADEMGKAAKARFDKMFTGQAMGEQYTQLYHKLAGQ